MTSEVTSWYKTELPQSHVYQLDTDIDMLWDGTEDIGFGPRFLGEIRKGQWHAELGGPKHAYVSFMFAEVVDNADDVVDGRVEIYGPDLNELPPETTVPFVQHVRLWGPNLNEDHTEFAARGIATGWIQMEGCGWIGTPDTVWLRVSKQVAPRLSWKKICQIIRANTMTECPLVEKVEIKMVIGTPEVGGREIIQKVIDEIKPKWDALAAKHAAVADEDVDLFYGCTLCKMIAPNHACVVTPAVVPYCGVLSFYTCKAIYDTDPFGYVFALPKGDTIDAVTGRYTGVDEVIWEKSDHRHKRFDLHSVIKYPTTN